MQNQNMQQFENTKI